MGIKLRENFLKFVKFSAFQGILFFFPMNDARNGTFSSRHSLISSLSCNINSSIILIVFTPDLHLNIYFLTKFLEIWDSKRFVKERYLTSCTVPRLICIYKQLLEIINLQKATLPANRLQTLKALQS